MDLDANDGKPKLAIERRATVEARAIAAAICERMRTCNGIVTTWPYDAGVGPTVKLLVEARTKAERLAAERDACLAACEMARKRFSDQNGRVSLDVWKANYEAVCSLDDAIALCTKGKTE